MTHDRTIELWEQAGFVWAELGFRDRLCIAEFVKLIRADERSACIAACNSVDLVGADECIEAIRTLGDRAKGGRA